MVKASKSDVNVNDIERAASVLFGVTLLGLGLRRASVASVPLAVGGGLLLYRGVSGKCPAYQALGVSTTPSDTGSGGRALALPHRARHENAAPVEHSITIRRPAEELMRRFKDPDTLSRVLGDIASVARSGTNQLEWQLKVAGVESARFKTRWVEAGASSLTWESLPDERFQMRGAVRFSPAPGDWGTVLTLRLELESLESGIGKALKQFMGSIPRKATLKALKRFKSLVEAGEIPTTDKNPTTRNGGRE